MKTRKCDYPKCCQRNGNCPHLGEDKLAIQCVGPWVRNKHYFLNRYLEATSEVRTMFSTKGNAVYIDLYSGPGKCITREENNEEIDGGCLLSLNQKEGSFNEYHFIDIENENIEAMKNRLGVKSGYNYYKSDSNIEIVSLIQQLLNQNERYHFVYIDPYGVSTLKFNTLKELAKLRRVDVLINFPTGDIRRNREAWIKQSNSYLDDFLGLETWRDKIKDKSNEQIYNILIDIFKNQLLAIGFPEEGLILPVKERIYADLPTVPIKNTKDVELYVLLFVSKHKLGLKIWNSIINIGPNGQRTLSFKP